MRDLRITLVQANQIWEDKQANLNHFEQLIAEVETDLFVFPEMFHTGFSMNPEKLAESMTESQGLSWLKRIAAEKNAACYTSLIIEENNCYFNRGVFVEPSGKTTIYDKRKRFALAGEDLVFSAGKSSTIVDYNGWKINLQICYDLRFPEICRNEIKDETALYDVLIYVANWPERRKHHWNSLLIARAIENQCIVIGVNRVGTDANSLSYSGNSVVINALGEITATTNENEEHIVTSFISKDSLLETREKLPFLKDK
ncbi:MAG: nitrilase family protein [Fluviicola sp.]|nr:nitrilase family protein [Fluviicola sp.]MBP6271181.1 nitrilase family protein [Fluviicola sp.]